MANIIRFGGGASDGKNPYEQIQNYLPLYWYGNECVENSGGWQLEDITVSKGYIDNPSKYTLTKNANSMVFNTVTNSGTSTSNGYSISTKNNVDVTEYDTLTISLSINETVSNTNTGVRFFTIGNKSNYIESDEKGLYIQYDTRLKGNTFSGSLSVDLASLSGSVYVGVYQGHAGGYETTNNLTSTISSVYLTKQDDITTLAQKCGSSATTIEGLLADSAKIFASKDAVQFMVAQCTGDFMVEACQCDNFLDALATSEYAYLIYMNEHWIKFIMAFANASHKLYLLVDGNECVDVTDGYSIKDCASLSNTRYTITEGNKNNGQYFTFTSGQNDINALATEQLINLSGYTKFCFKSKCTKVDNSYGGVVALTTSKSNLATMEGTRIELSSVESSITEHSANINSTQNVYVVAHSAGSNATRQFNLYAIWLES